MPRHYQFRTLRSDFIDLCDGNRIAALLLDYFWQQGQKLIERQMNGSPESHYIPLGWNYAILITLMPIGKNAIKRAVAALVERGYITPHSENGQWAANVTNRYRVEMAVIQSDLNRWSESETYVQPDLPRSRQIYPYVQPDLPPRSAQTYPLGPVGPYESVKESAYESPSSSPAQPVAMAMTIADIDELISSLLGRRPTKAQQQQMLQMLTRFNHEQIRLAVDVAAANDKRSLAYVRAILENNHNGNGKHAQPAAQPERVYFTAPEDDAPAMTPEEMAEVRAQLKALRSGQS
jgi:DnaD/phage-associated family protein